MVFLMPSKQTNFLKNGLHILSRYTCKPNIVGGVKYIFRSTRQNIFGVGTEGESSPNYCFDKFCSNESSMSMSLSGGKT